ncbi:MAG: hypothetical protein IPM24_21585 [Bryobacterales bacterium]|nr:hypothetical protein [Bryobacterales bacterium]
MSGEESAEYLVSAIEELMAEKLRKQDPDYQITVYCDKHLGVNMRLEASWGSMEYGDTSVDVNRLIEWCCPKPGCHRHYEPTILGYYDRELGRRLRRDAKRQPRGNHSGRPFMYVGKVGDGRGYLCPLYKCDERGPVVAESVVDEEVRLPTDPLAILKKAERKRAIEMDVFLSFASTSKLSIDAGSPENRDPDYPDIMCTISGQKYWFELGQIIHEEVAEKVNPKRRTLDDGFSYDQDRPFVNLIVSKAEKKYETDCAPVDLVLHFDLRFGTAASVLRLCEKHSAILAALTSTGPFERVWVFDEFNKTVILSS